MSEDEREARAKLRQAQKEEARAERQAARLAEREQARAERGDEQRPAGLVLDDVAQSAAPLPPDALIARALPNPDPVWFDQSGALLLTDWQRGLAAIGRDLRSFRRTLDLGSAAGRVMRHVRGQLRRDQTIVGLDEDAEAVRWLREDLELEAAVLPAAPPAPYPRDFFDLAFCHDLLAAAPLDAQGAWLEELHRMLAPKALALVAINGRETVPEPQRGAGGDAAAASLARDGAVHIPGTGSWQTIGHVEQAWSRWFRVRAWLPTAVLAQRDMVVLEKI